jgi:hypothetical protein
MLDSGEKDSSPVFLYILPLAWGAVATVVVTACQAASRADRPEQPSR